MDDIIYPCPNLSQFLLVKMAPGVISTGILFISMSINTSQHYYIHCDNKVFYVYTLHKENP